MELYCLDQSFIVSFGLVFLSGMFFLGYEDRLVQTFSLMVC